MKLKKMIVWNNVGGLKMKIKITCPHCGQQIQIDSKKIEQAIKKQEQQKNDMPDFLKQLFL
jgi:hypothetical protein